MKCIQCQTENNLEKRTTHLGHCWICDRQFAFEPTTMLTVKMTDPMFKKTIDELSVNNTLFFTEKQFTYCLDKRLRRLYDIEIGAMGGNGNSYILINIFFTIFLGNFSGSVLLAMGLKLPMAFYLIAANFIWQGITIRQLRKNLISTSMDVKSRRSSAQQLRRLGFLILLLGIPASLIIAPSPILFVAAVLMGMRAISWGNDRSSIPRNISQELLFQSSDIKGWLRRWQEVHGIVFRLLSPPTNKNAPAAINPDVTAYSFDRLVVCQSAEVAQMLIANNFHFENNCAILSIEGYPQDIFDVTMQMLRRNLDLKVYIFHDCSPQGIGILQQLKTSDRWFKNSNVAIIDIGITPSQVMKSNNLFIHTSTTSAEVAKRVSPSDWTGLTLDEVAWLEAGNYVELESFTPQQLIQVLNRGIAGTRNLLDGSDSYTSIGGADGYLYTTQSFG